ncbi:MAG TPA: trypsin-like peptidase domain-containing protein [Actinomycetota bacterium]|nr:trypsin-like peptidase domain-containing protein [Actinomycetota bacterium]
MKTKLALLLAVASFVGAACVVTTSDRTTATSTPDPNVTLTQNVAPPPHSKLADVVAQDLPSVVNVRVKSVQFDPLGGTQDVKGQGSGVVIDKDGVILTNFHVVSGAVNVRVVFNDDHDPVEGKVIGTAPERDLAVVKVPETDLTPIVIGKSSSLRLGDSVLAIGFPLGLGGPTVTSGIVSGQERSISVPREDGTTEHLEGMLQTDAAINPGNSGGALVDAAGRLVGINTAAAGAGNAENVGFAISIDSALPVVREILSKPPEQRAWLGVIIRSMDAQVAGELNLDPDLKGALITDVVSGGPAEAAGLDTGDVITSVDGHPIASAEDLTTTLSDLSPGDAVPVRVTNSSGTKTVTVTLAERPITFDK